MLVVSLLSVAAALLLYAIIKDELKKRPSPPLGDLCFSVAHVEGEGIKGEGHWINFSELADEGNVKNASKKMQTFLKSGRIHDTHIDHETEHVQ